jgi:hypothetical protein
MQYHHTMRTTLDIEDDVLSAAKDLARREKKTAGQVISDLARKGLTGGAASTASEPKAIYGLRPFPKEGRIVSNELINKLREDGEY